MRDQLAVANRSLARVKREITHGLLLLAEASDLAADTNCCAHKFAVKIGQLQRAGIHELHLRWLIEKHYIEHLLDTTVFGEHERSIRPTSSEHFSKRSCFLLTQLGRNFADSVLAPKQNEQLGTDKPLSLTGAQHALPVWDSNTKCLYFRNRIVKRFHRHSPNQELILSAFQEDGWPERLDDPLPPKGNADRSSRLSKTVYSLNGSLDSRPISFFCEDSTVCWETNHRQKNRIQSKRKHPKQSSSRNRRGINKES